MCLNIEEPLFELVYSHKEILNEESPFKEGEMHDV